MKFGEAIELLKEGKCVARDGWNGRGMFLWLQEGSYPIDKPTSGIVDGVPITLFDKGDNGTVASMPTICMRTANGNNATGWLASQADILAEDWHEVFLSRSSK